MRGVQKVRRLLQLLECLQSGRTFNTKELSDFCGVSRRTIFRDLKALQDSGVQLLYDSERQGYWIPKSAMLPPTELSLAESLSIIILAQELGSKDHGLPFHEAARDAALKIRGNLPADLQDHLQELSQVIRIEKPRTADLDHSRQHYERILEASRTRKKVRLRYGSLHEGKTIQTLISPYVVLFKKHAWYVIGRSSLHRAVRTFHIGRIEHSETLTDQFEIPPRFSVKRHLGKAWSMVREKGNRVQVTVRFQPLVAKNVAEVVWHSTQKVIWNDDGSIDYTVEVDGLKEMSWWILGYGDQAEVLEPDEMRQLVKKHIQNLSRVYRKKPKRR